MKIWALYQMAASEIKIKADDLGLGTGAPKEIGEAQIQGILGAVYLVAGIVAVLAIIIGAVRFMAANGEAAKVSTAKNVISYAVVGLVVVLMAAALTNWVIGQVG